MFWALYALGFWVLGYLLDMSGYLLCLALGYLQDGWAMKPSVSLPMNPGASAAGSAHSGRSLPCPEPARR